MRRPWALLSFVFWWAAAAQAAKLLAVLPTNTRSHYAMYGRLLEALAARGHDITIISHFSMKHLPLNVEEISLAGTIPEITNNLTRQQRTLKPNFVQNLEQIMKECVHACDVVSKAPEVRALLNSSATFDLIIVEVFGTECFLPLGRRFDAPVVGLLSSVPLPWVNQQLGNPEATAYVPAYMMGYGQRMSLWERYINTISVLIAKILYKYKSQMPSQAIAERLFGPRPHSDISAQEYSIVLSNSHFSINEVRPMVPALVEVGGLHLDNTQKIHKDFKHLLDTWREGVVYWSFGSMSRIETISKDILSQIFGVFAELPMKILIKMNRASLPSNITVPENVYTKAWIPQYQTLCHPNLKLFISHGGLLGIQEAVTCGVPMLVIPLYADQALNARAMADKGVARVLPLKEITTITWRDSLNDLLNNHKYRGNAAFLKDLFLDRPLPPLEMAVYWIEYTLRHKGAKHLRSPALDLPLHQTLLLDIIVINIVLILITIQLLHLLFRYLCTRCIKWWPIEQKLVFEKSIVKSIVFYGIQKGTIPYTAEGTGFITRDEFATYSDQRSQSPVSARNISLAFVIKYNKLKMRDYEL